MKSHCILCSKHVVSLRSLTAHLRSNHPGGPSKVPSKGGGLRRYLQRVGTLEGIFEGWGSSKVPSKGGGLFEGPFEGAFEGPFEGTFEGLHLSRSKAFDLQRLAPPGPPRGPSLKA